MSRPRPVERSSGRAPSQAAESVGETGGPCVRVSNAGEGVWFGFGVLLLSSS